MCTQPTPSHTLTHTHTHTLTHTHSLTHSHRIVEQRDELQSKLEMLEQVVASAYHQIPEVSCPSCHSAALA